MYFYSTGYLDWIVKNELFTEPNNQFWISQIPSYYIFTITKGWLGVGSCKIKCYECAIMIFSP